DTVVRTRCPDCLPLLSDVSESAGLNDDSLRTWIAGRAGVGPANSDSDAVAATAFARTAAAAEALGGDRAVEVSRTLAKTGEGLDRAIGLVRAGQRESAGEAALDAYLAFERIETPLRARDSRAASAVERAFGEVRSMLAQGSEAEILQARVAVDSTLA